MEKKKMKMPHMYCFLLGFLIIMSLLTYIIPAGEFATGADGTLDGNSFAFLGHQTPVNPWDAMLHIFSGIKGGASVIAMVLVNGGAIGAILSTKALDRVMDYSVYRLKDKGVSILVPAVAVMIAVISCVGFGDWLMALTPVGIMVAAKLGLDPLVALGITISAVLIGNSWSPINLHVVQPMMEVELFSGYGVRTLMTVVIFTLYALIITRYALKIHKDPSKSLMGDSGWLERLKSQNSEEIKAVSLNGKDVLIVFCLIFQYVVIVYLKTRFGYGNEVVLAVVIITCTICGLLAGWNLNEVGQAFARGCNNMAFICFLIGLATAMSQVMSEGHIIHTIVYFACLPLRGLSHGLAAVGISVVITGLNFLIPSLSAKAALIIPIVKPMCEALSLPAQVGVQCYQIGDTFSNALTPFMAMTVGACELAGVPFNKYIRISIRIVAPLWIVSQIALFFLANAQWGA